MFAQKIPKAISRWLVVGLMVWLLLAACSPTNSAPTQPATTATQAAATTQPVDATTQPVDKATEPVPTTTLAPTVTMTPEATVAPEEVGIPQFSMDTGSVATGFQTETIAGAPTPSDGPYWEIVPAYTRLTLEGYPIADHLLMPYIFILPADELAASNEGAAQTIASLQALLQAPQEIPTMPFLPLLNAAQAMHTQVQYLDFVSGQGLRYLAQFDQGIVPINNYELIYTYQGLTSDGRYYVSAVLPVNHPSLPVDVLITGNEPPEFSSDFPAYLANVAAALNTQGANTFTPDLTHLDAMISSIEIK